MEREEYPNTYQLRACVVTCKPGFDDWCRTIEAWDKHLSEFNSALIWYIRNKPEMPEMPLETDMYPEWGPWNEKLLKLYKEAEEQNVRNLNDIE